MLIIKAALSDNWVIGNEGKIPWHSPEDLRRFKKRTMGHVCIVGRKTYETMPKLPGRELFVVTSNPSSVAGCNVIMDVPRMMGFLKSDIQTDDIFVIGGAQVYEQFLPHADRMELTRVHIDVEGDTLFPSFAEDRHGWRITEREDYIDGDLFLTFETWVRNRVEVEVTWC